MTSFGRGRGILPSKKVSAPLPTNGYSSVLVPSPADIVLPSPAATAAATYVNLKSPPDLHSFGEKLLSLRDDECLFPLIFDIISNDMCTVEIVERMVAIIIDRCMWLPSVSKKYADLLSILTLHKIFGKNIRQFTFNSLQNFFEDREELLKSKKYGESTFRNVVILTGEIYYRYRIQNSKSRYSIFHQPMLTYLKMLVKSKDEGDILTLSQQISWNGCEISKADKEAFDELMFDVRRCIVNSNDYTQKTKWVLLLCHELSFKSFEYLPDNVKTFYQKNLGGNILATIFPPPLALDNPLDPDYFRPIQHFFL